MMQTSPSDENEASSVGNAADVANDAVLSPVFCQYVLFLDGFTVCGLL